jgi:hypothetical protein
VTGWLRRAGSGRALDGSLVAWTVAEGRRGRRWREVVVAPDGGIRSSLLLELDPDGRFSHLELSTAAGLLTLHPEGDGTLHGNAVTAAGVDHVRGDPWQPEAAIALEGSWICAAATRRADGSWPAAALRIGLDLSMATEPAAFDPSQVDRDGLPALDGGITWPLEESE